MKMEKITLKRIIDLFFYYFDKGSQDAILNISMEMQDIYFHSIYLKPIHSSILCFKKFLPI